MARLKRVILDAIGLGVFAVIVIILSTYGKQWQNVDIMVINNAHKVIVQRELILNLLTTLAIISLFLPIIWDFLNRSSKAYRWDVLILYGLPSLWLMLSPMLSFYGLHSLALPYYKIFVVLGHNTNLIISMILGLGIIKFLKTEAS